MYVPSNIGRGLVQLDPRMDTELLPFLWEGLELQIPSLVDVREEVDSSSSLTSSVGTRLLTSPLLLYSGSFRGGGR